MNVEVVGGKIWYSIHHICQEYDRGVINDPQNIYSYMHSLPKTFCCIYCRNSLGPFLEELDPQFRHALQHREMRRLSYDLHNKVNNKLLRQEDDRVTECMHKHLSELQRDRSCLREISNELSCILYTKTPPSYEDFLHRKYPRNEKFFWDSIHCITHGYSLNESAKPEDYNIFLHSILSLLWPGIMKATENSYKIHRIIRDPQISYLRKSWLIQRVIFDMTRVMQEQKLEKILCQSPVINIDDIRALGIMHKNSIEQTFEELLAEMKSYESGCAKAKSCRKSAILT